MTTTPDIDVLYERFCSALPTDVQPLARSLAFELKLVPTPSVPWSAVFKHAVTLQAPRLLAEGISAESPAIERAVLAHMLAVIEAFGTDRIADQQVDDKPELHRVLSFVRTARDEALSAIGGDDAMRMARAADLETRAAIASERTILGRGEPVDFLTYEATSAGKQAVGIPASVALAKSARLGSAQLDIVRSTLMGIWLGLQFQDDVADWEDDIAHGGAWAVVLARQARFENKTHGAPNLKHLVLSSGVLAEMLALSASRFYSAVAGAESLGAGRLAEWLRARAAEVFDFCEKERRNPGYLWRMKRLAPWASEVLG
jgi:hypothetical protein